MKQIRSEKCDIAEFRKCDKVMKSEASFQIFSILLSGLSLLQFQILQEKLNISS